MALMIEILNPSPWQMTFGERAALEGILAQLRPRTAIEIGTAEGGSLQRLAHHSEHVHSFDLVAPQPDAAQLGNVTFHTGDSHMLLPELLGRLAAEGVNVDFVLVDGDHTADGAERDLRDLLASDAIRRTVIVLHDTLNDLVREGFRRIDYAAEHKVAYADLDFVGGHLGYGGPFHHQLWGGLGIVVVDAEGHRVSDEGDDQGRFYELFELLSPVRDALVAHEAAGGAVGAGSVSEAVRTSRAELDRARNDAAASRHWLEELQRSASWRITAPLRAAQRRLRERGF
jgi:Methyltransferase domain